MHLNSVLKGMDKQVQDRDPHLKLIRVGQNDPQTVRLVFEVKQAMSPQVLELTPVAEFKNRLVLDFYPKMVLQQKTILCWHCWKITTAVISKKACRVKRRNRVKPVRTGRLSL